jgi:DUF4097 and DUF4098 domain-containing protein YvlB
MPTFDTPEPIVVTIDITGGRVWLRASDRADTVVEVRPTDTTQDLDVQAAEQTQIEYAGGQLSVKAPKNRFRSLFGRSPSVDVTVDLPTGSRVEAKAWADFSSEGLLGDSTFDTAAGSIRLDRTGRLRLRTAAGNISVAGTAGHTDISSSTGKIWIGAIDGTAVVKTSNGDITVGEVTGDAKLNSANGDITVDHALAAVGAKTAHGSVRIGEVVHGPVVLESGFGELELGVREGTAAWLDASSNNGMVRCDLDAADGAGPSDRTVEVRARTGYGDIIVHRS